MALALVLACGVPAVDGTAAGMLAFESIFHGGAVLQQGAGVSVWGTAGAGGPRDVSVSINGQLAATATVTPDDR